VTFETNDNYSIRFEMKKTLCVMSNNKQLTVDHHLDLSGSSDVIGYVTLWSQVYQNYLVLCKYSKFRIESNSYFSIEFEMSTIIRNF